jgi:hypothetical protein
VKVHTINRMCAIILAALVGLPTFAQTPDRATNALIDAVFRETEHNKSEILQKLRPTLSDREKAVLDQLRFTIDRNSWNIAEVYADVGVVNVSMGFVIHVNMINGAMAFEIYESTRTNRTSNLTRPIDFANYYVDALAANRRAEMLGRQAVPVKSYFQWLGMTAAEISALKARLDGDPRYLQTLAMVNNGNLAMALAHELGHHALGHIPVRSPLNPKDEAAADAFAFKHVVKAGYPPILALGTFMMFDRFERRDGPEPIATDHPPALCRWFRALSSGWAAIKDDRDLLAEFERRGRSGEVERMNDLIEDGERQFAEKCPIASYELCDVVARHMSGPPSAFVEERGEPKGQGSWRAKSAMPNAACYVRLRDSSVRTQHEFSCIVNSRNHEPVVQKYHDAAVGELTACIGQMRNAARWTRTPVEDNDDDEVTTGQEWALAEGPANYRIKIETTRKKATPEFFNYLLIEYTLRNGQ